MSNEGISGIAAKTGASSLDIKNVLSSALPQMFSGADKQNTNAETSQGFVNALSQHAQSDTSNLSNFFGNVDLADGSKIIGHLLGKDGSNNVAAETGVNSANTSNILSSAAPLVMSLLGKQFSKEKKSMGSRIVDEPEEKKEKRQATKTAVSGSVKPASQSWKSQFKQNGSGGTAKKVIKKKSD